MMALTPAQRRVVGVMLKHEESPSMKVYLSGGMESGWQDEVVKGCPKHEFLDPRNNECDQAMLYTFLDLVNIRSCDLLFAYMEESNPSGIGLSLEVGYALGLGKPVILICEKAGYFAIVREAASVTLPCLNKGIALLNHLAP